MELQHAKGCPFHSDCVSKLYVKGGCIPWTETLLPTLTCEVRLQWRRTHWVVVPWVFVDVFLMVVFFIATVTSSFHFVFFLDVGVGHFLTLEEVNVDEHLDLVVEGGGVKDALNPNPQPYSLWRFAFLWVGRPQKAGHSARTWRGPWTMLQNLLGGPERCRVADPNQSWSGWQTDYKYSEFTWIYVKFHM